MHMGLSLDPQPVLNDYTENLIATVLGGLALPFIVAFTTAAVVVLRRKRSLKCLGRDLRGYSPNLKDASTAVGQMTILENRENVSVNIQEQVCIFHRQGACECTSDPDARYRESDMQNYESNTYWEIGEIETTRESDYEQLQKVTELNDPTYSKMPHSGLFTYVRRTDLTTPLEESKAEEALLNNENEEINEKRESIPDDNHLDKDYLHPTYNRCKDISFSMHTAERNSHQDNENEDF